MNPIETEIQTENLTSIVARVLKIESITTGTPQDGYLARYRGHLYGDSSQAYDKLAKDIDSYKLTPLFRMTEDDHEIILIPAAAKPRPSNPWVNVLMFILTIITMLFAGALYGYTGPEPESFLDFVRVLPSGLPFAVSLMAILLAHEFGHYLAARFHDTNVTLPYFIPFPSLFGTLGAFIRLKEPPKNKRILLDIGIAGPLAGLVVAIPVLLYGLFLSSLQTIEIPAGQGLVLEGNSILYLLAKYTMFGQLLPAPSNYGGLPPLIYWIRYFFTSQPLPIGGVDVWISPIAWAGWAGLLVTALNLIPAGQLDGGHVIYVLLGKRSKILLPFILVALVLLGFAWQGWWVWAFLIFLLGRFQAEPLDQITSLDNRRKAIAVFGLIVFVLVFTPVPLLQTMVGG